MRKQFFNLLLVCLLLTFAAPQAMNAAVSSSTNAPATEKPVDAERVNQLMHRLNEIKDMDKSKLTREEKKALRKEVKNTKKELKAIGGSIYISVGALILIALLLILLL